MRKGPGIVASLPLLRTRARERKDWRRRELRCDRAVRGLHIRKSHLANGVSSSSRTTAFRQAEGLQRATSHSLHIGGSGLAHNR